MERPLGAVILAAGLGTRMRSTRAKVLHELAGLPLIRYPLAALRALRAAQVVVVVGHQADAVAAAAPPGSPGSRRRSSPSSAAPGTRSHAARPGSSTSKGTC